MSRHRTIVPTVAPDTGLPRLRRLATVAKALDVPICTLRREIYADRLRCVRLRPTANAPIYLRDEDVRAWLDASAQRQLARRPGR